MTTVMEKTKPKIAVMMNAFWNAGSGGLSGGDQRLIQIFKRLSADLDITIFTSRDGQKVVGDQIDGARFVISPAFTNRGIIHLAYFCRSIWGLFLLNSRRFDFVYGSSDFLPDVIPCFFYRVWYPKTKWIQCIFHYYPDWQTRPGNKLINFVAYVSQRFSFLFIKRADRIININHQVRDRLIQDGFNSRKLLINYCGIDLDFLNKIKPIKLDSRLRGNDKRGSGNDSDWLQKELAGSFLARLNPSKGIFDLPQIWKKVVEKYPKAKLKIIGGGNEEIKNKLGKMIEELKLEKNIKLCGYLPDETAFQIIADSNVFLFPSHEEGFGMAIAEAMAAGAPCVVWNLPVYSEVFPQVLTTAEEGNIDEFASRVMKLLADKKLAENFSSRGHGFVKRYGWDKIAENEFNIILKGW